MKHFWALPAFLRPALVQASQQAFSVHEDVLAFPQYEVNFSEDYLSESQAQSRLDSGEGSEPDVGKWTEGQKRKPDERLEYETMVLDGQKYLCAIPQVVVEDGGGGGNETAERAEQESELARASVRGWELLSGMQGQCVYFVSGWWSYRFCYNEGVKQFHQLPPGRGVPHYPPVEDPGVTGFMLGKYEGKKGGGAGGKHSEEKWEGEGALEVSQHSRRKSAGAGELVERGESRYLVQRLEGGTVCDLTGKERRVEVQVRDPLLHSHLSKPNNTHQFHCNPSTGSDRISLIKETSTCAYLMVIQTPRLCSDVAFQPRQKDAANPITCRPVFSPEAAETYERELKALKAADKEHDIWIQDPDAAAAFGMDHMLLNSPSSPKIVGDVLLGGHSIVPQDFVLEKSAIVGGGKETYIETVANSEGRMLTQAEMEKLGLGDARAVEELKKKLEKIAGQGGTWKLDVIDTPRGREYRGIIGDEDEDEEEGGESGKGEEKGKEGDGGGDGGEQSGEGSQEEFYKEEL